MKTEVEIVPSTNRNRMLRVLTEIAADMEADATNFDGQPFNGKTVAEYFGNQGAAIAALAKIIAATGICPCAKRSHLTACVVDLSVGRTQSRTSPGRASVATSGPHGTPTGGTVRHKPKLARVISQKEWPALYRRDREPTVFIYADAATIAWLATRVGHSARGDYMATAGRELPRALAALSRRPRPLRAVDIRLEWPKP